MRYNDRVKIVTTTEDDEWGDTTSTTSDWLACRITGVSTQMNMNVFGKYTSNALAVHFKTKLSQVDYVLIDDVKRKPQAVLQARKNTVIIVQAV